MLIAQWIPIFILLIFVAYYIPNTQRKKIGDFPALLWSLLADSALVHAFSPMLYAKFSMDTMAIKIQLSAAATFMVILFLPWMILQMSEKAERWAVWTLIGFLFVDALFMMLKLNGHRGLIDANTFDMTVIALSLPLLGQSKYIRSNWIFISLIAFFMAAIFFLNPGGSTAKVVTMLTILGWLVASKKWIAVGVAVAAIAVAFFYVDDFTQYSDRAQIISNYLEYWISSGKFMFGMGFGSITEIAMFEKLKVLPATAQGFPLLIHNDYVQILFEGGIVNLAFMLCLMGLALWHLRKKPDFFGAAIGYSFAMFTYYPIHFLPSAFIGLLILREAFCVEEI